MDIFCIFCLCLKVQKRLKNEPGICCIAISNDACRVVFGIAGFNKYVTTQLQSLMCVYYVCNAGITPNALNYSRKKFVIFVWCKLTNIAHKSRLLWTQHKGEVCSLMAKYFFMFVFNMLLQLLELNLLFVNTMWQYYSECRNQFRNYTLHLWTDIIIF